MSDPSDQPIRGSWRCAAWGGVLSLAMPGLGQVYARSWRLGVVLLTVITLLGITTRVLSRLLPPDPAALGLLLALLAAILACYAGAPIHAVRRIRLYPDPAKPRWFRSTWFTAAVFLSINVGIDTAAPLQLGWRTFSIPSGGTLPTLLVGDMIVTDTTGSVIMPAYGDMIVFLLPRDPSQTFIKRVVGLPGDRVQMKRGQLYVNSTIMPRQSAGDYVTQGDGPRMLLRRFIETLPNGSSHAILKAADDGPLDNTILYRVPADSVFVLGDNRDNSQDSRMMDAVGFIPSDNVIGRAWTVLWSPRMARILSRID